MSSSSCCTSLALSWSLLMVGIVYADPIDLLPDDGISSLSIRVKLADESERMDGLLGVDLGLGFPLWLKPDGVPVGETQWGGYLTSPDPMKPGKVATFTFSDKQPLGSTGSSDLAPTRVRAATRQLLSDVRVGDINRIAFVSAAGSGEWTLASYEIMINGQTLSKNDQVMLGPKSAQSRAGEQISQLTRANHERDEAIKSLQDLVEAGFANDEEQHRLAALKAENSAHESRLAELKSTVDKTGPWFVGRFHSPWREAEGVSQAQVMLLTASGQHTGSDNFVYLQTGGRKFLLASPEKPLDHTHSLQTFDLDLTESSLSAADLRGIGLGVIAHDKPQSEAQAGWRPARLLIRLGDRYVYDSAENELDQRSLEAITLAPEYRVDSGGSVVGSTITSSVLPVWRAGRADGVDLSISAGTDPASTAVNAADSATIPDQHLSGIADANSDDGTDAIPNPGGTPNLADQPDSATNHAADISPGNSTAVTDLGDNSLPTGMDAIASDTSVSGNHSQIPHGQALADTFFPNSSTDPYATDILGNGSGLAGPLPNSVAPLPFHPDQFSANPTQTLTPQPAGKPPQVARVSVIGPVQIGKPFKVEWTTHGEDSLDSYQINVYEAHPDRSIFTGALVAQAQQPIGIGSAELTIDAMDDGEMVVVEVVGLPLDSSITPTQPTLSPLTVVLPANAESTSSGILFPDFQHGGNQQRDGRVTLTAPEEGAGVWGIGEALSHTGLTMGASTGSLNIALRPANANEQVTIATAYEINGKSRLVGHVGFLEGISGDSSLDADVAFHLVPTVGKDGHLEFLRDSKNVQLSLSATSKNQGPTSKIDHLIDFKGIDEGKWLVLVQITIKAKHFDPENPPAIFGLHMRPAK